jgi:AcrR family transcriptional regulator
VFAAHGYSAGTTNRIAAEAGLSVGSLYQYFPNKDAILIELVRAHIDDGAAVVLAAVGDAEQAGQVAEPGVVLRRVVSAMVDLHARDRRLHRVLFEESPRPPSLLAELRDLEDAAVAGVAELLGDARPELTDPLLTSRIVVVTVESLVHRLVAGDHDLDTGRVVDDITRLVVAYLDTVPNRAEVSASAGI